MNNEQILKDKSDEWPLKKYEHRFKSFIVPKIPLWLETYHLTWMTAIWSILVLACFYFGNKEQFYLWLIPLLIILQYITDLLDGEIGRVRDTGLVRWGYYADHFFDFVFMTSIVMGYGMLIGFNIWIFLIYAVLCGFMIHIFLLVSASNKFNVSFLNIGPSEGRVIMIIFHFVFMFEGIIIIETFLPYVAIFFAFSLTVAFLTSQKELWKMDMEKKNFK